MHSVSVIIPSFKSEAWVVRAVKSLMGNESLNVEIIVVEDGAFDQTRKALNPFGGNVKLYTLPENRGAPYARNFGLSKASNDCILFLDADDYITEGYLFNAVYELANSESDMCLCPWQKCSKEYEGAIHYPDNINPTSIMKKWMTLNQFIPSCGILWNRRLLEKIGAWDETLKKNQDMDIAFRAFLAKPEITLSKAGSAVYWQHDSENRISDAAPSNFVDSMNAIYKKLNVKMVNELGSEVVGEWCYRYAKIFYSLNRFDDGKVWLSRARYFGFKKHSGNNLSRILAFFLGLRRSQALIQYIKSFGFPKSS